MWIPLRASGRAGVTHYMRLMWPAVFVPVKLLPRDEVPSSGDVEHGPTPEQGRKDAAHKYTLEREVVDFLTPSLYRKLLIRRPFASIMTPPKWTSDPAGTPFLVCFPRAGEDGLGDRCFIYRIFPCVDASGEVINPQCETPIPLVFPARWSDRWYEDGVHVEAETGSAVPSDGGRDASEGGADGAAADPVYRALIVISHHAGSTRTKFSAIWLANVPVDGSDPPQYEPRCKIMSHWTPEDKIDPRTLHVGTFPAADRSGDLLVPVQKVSCSGERRQAGMRSVNLTQVVFDGGGLRDCFEARRAEEVAGVGSDRDIWRRNLD